MVFDWNWLWVKPNLQFDYWKIRFDVRFDGDVRQNHKLNFWTERIVIAIALYLLMIESYNINLITVYLFIPICKVE